MASFDYNFPNPLVFPVFLFFHTNYGCCYLIPGGITQLEFEKGMPTQSHSSVTIMKMALLANSQLFIHINKAFGTQCESEFIACKAHMNNAR